jgi:hypothetical protein
MKRSDYSFKVTFTVMLITLGCIYPASQSFAQSTWGTTPLGPNVPPLKWTPAEIKRPLQTHFKSFPATGEKLIVANDGKPLATIVISLHASDSSQEAAAVLQKTFQEISGAKLPLITDNKLNPASQETYISLGDTALSRKANIKASDLLAGGYRIKTQEKVLFIVGNDVGSGMPANGTRNGVYALLENHLGCRWLWPGELGAVLPHESTLTLNPINEQDEPALPVRGMRNFYPEQKDNLNKLHVQGLQRLNRNSDDFLKKTSGSNDWLDSVQLGKSAHYSYGHGFNDYWNKYGESHPEFFALQPDGTRDQGKIGGPHADRARLDVANEGLIETVAANAIQRFKDNPNLSSVSISPNDGGPQGFDMSEADRKLDPPNAPKITLNLGKGHGNSEYVSLSDRYVTFYAKVAAIVGKQFPDKLLGSYAYSAYRTPPLYAKLPSNVLVGFVGLNYFNDAQRQTDLESWDGWTRAASHLLLRPNALIGGHGFPAVYTHKLGADIKHCYQTGMMATDFDSIMHNWAGNGLDYYVLAKLLWDPSQNVDDIVKDYCDKGFGKASPAVQKYFSALEDLTDEVAADPADAEHEEEALSGNSFYTLLSVLSRHYTDAKLDHLQSLLDDAKTQAAGDATVLRRIEFLEQGIRYARAEVAPVRLFIQMRTDSKTHTDANKQKLLELLKNRQKVFQDIFDNHFYAQDVLYPLYRETSMWREYGWNPGNEK